MKLNGNFITHKTGDKYVMICLDRKKFSGIVRLNETACFVVEQLKKDVSTEEILAAMKKEYEVDEETAERDIERVLNVLREIGALDE